MDTITSVGEDNTKFIWQLFRGRCIICGKAATEINEIILRSRSKTAVSDWKNRVTLCRSHHDEYHRKGVTPAKVAEMQEARKKFLLKIGRGEFI